MATELNRVNRGYSTGIHYFALAAIPDRPIQSNACTSQGRSEAFKSLLGCDLTEILIFEIGRTGSVVYRGALRVGQAWRWCHDSDRAKEMAGYGAKLQQNGNGRGAGINRASDYY